MHQGDIGQMSRFLVYNNLKRHDMEIAPTFPYFDVHTSEMAVERGKNVG